MLIFIDTSYWVIGVVPYLLYCFVLDHDLETCQRIYRVITSFRLSISYLTSNFFLDPCCFGHVESSRLRMLAFLLPTHLNIAHYM